MSQQNLKFENLRGMAGVLIRFSFAATAEKQHKWCLEKGIAKEIENYEPTQLKTLLERSNAEIKNKNG